VTALASDSMFLSIDFVRVTNCFNDYDLIVPERYCPGCGTAPSHSGTVSGIPGQVVTLHVSQANQRRIVAETRQSIHVHYRLR